MASPLDLASAVILGAVQGATEFLPVSSDGHIAIGALLLSIPDLPLAMVVVLHAGTLLATLLVLGPELWQLVVAFGRGLRTPREYLRTDQGRLLSAIVVASIPTAVIGLVLEDRVESWAHVPWIVGICLLGTAAAVWVTRYGGGAREVPTIPMALLVGVVQGLAVLPGLSRSGTTIACAMMLGLTGPAAFRYSFLLSLPAVGGALALQLLKPGVFEEMGVSIWIGAAVALVVGYAALRILRELVGRGKFWAFAVYLVPLAIVLLAYDALRSS
jgi:undecaprenyl-diphosphatase